MSEGDINRTFASCNERFARASVKPDLENIKKSYKHLLMLQLVIL